MQLGAPLSTSAIISPTSEPYAGTLGAFCRDNLTERDGILSNNHVLANTNDASVGESSTEKPAFVSALQDEAKDAIGAFLRGEPVELHQVMAATEEAGIALEMLIEIRNKITDAYRAVINMQG